MPCYVWMLGNFFLDSMPHLYSHRVTSFEYIHGRTRTTRTTCPAMFKFLAMSFKTVHQIYIATEPLVTLFLWGWSFVTARGRLTIHIGRLKIHSGGEILKFHHPIGCELLILVSHTDTRLIFTPKWMYFHADFTSGVRLRKCGVLIR